MVYNFSPMGGVRTGNPWVKAGEERARGTLLTSGQMKPREKSRRGSECLARTPQRLTMTPASYQEENRAGCGDQTQS